MGLFVSLKKRVDDKVSLKKVHVTPEETLGIETLKKVSADAFDITEALIDLFQDFGTAPLFKILSIAGEYEDVSGVFAQAAEEAKDLTPEEMAELADHLATEFDIPNDEVEAEIEAVLRIPAEVFSAYRSAEVVVNTLKGVVSDDTMNTEEKVRAVAAQVEGLVDEAISVINLGGSIIQRIKDLVTSNDAE